MMVAAGGRGAVAIDVRFELQTCCRHTYLQRTCKKYTAQARAAQPALCIAQKHFKSTCTDIPFKKIFLNTANLSKCLVWRHRSGLLQKGKSHLRRFTHDKLFPRATFHSETFLHTLGGYQCARLFWSCVVRKDSL